MDTLEAPTHQNLKFSLPSFNYQTQKRMNTENVKSISQYNVGNVSIKRNKKMYSCSPTKPPSILMYGIWEMLGHWESAGSLCCSILISGQPSIVKYSSDVRPRTACRRLNFLQLNIHNSVRDERFPNHSGNSSIP